MQTNQNGLISLESNVAIPKPAEISFVGVSVCCDLGAEGEALGSTLELRHDLNGKLQLTLDAPPSMLEAERFRVFSSSGEKPKICIPQATFGRWAHQKEAENSNICSFEAVVEYESLPEKFSIVFSLSGLCFRADSRTTVVCLENRKWEFVSLVNRNGLRHVFKENGFDYVCSILVVEDVTESEIPELREILERLLWMLTFACGGSVQNAREDLVSDGKVFRSTFYNTKKVMVPSLSPLCVESIAGQLKKFLEGCYDRWKSEEQRYVLRRTAHLLTLAKSEGIVNVRALLAANVLEVLRYNYAKNVLKNDGRVKIDPSSEDVEWCVNHLENKYLQLSPKKTRASFAQILGDLAKYLCLTGWNRDFVKMRNRIMHSGDMWGETTKIQIKNTKDCLHFCDTVILALLDWDKLNGKYRPFNEPNLIGPVEFGVKVKEFSR